MQDQLSDETFIDIFNNCPTLLDFGGFLLKDLSFESAPDEHFQMKWDNYYENFTYWITNRFSDDPIIYDKYKIIDYIRDKCADYEESDLDDNDLVLLYPHQVHSYIHSMLLSISEFYDEYQFNYGDSYSNKSLFFTAIAREYYIDHEGLNELLLLKNPDPYKSPRELLKIAEEIAINEHKHDIYGNHREPGDYFKYHLDEVRKIAKKIDGSSLHPHKIEIVALLHDIIEDHPDTENLIKNTFGDRLFNSIKLLTRDRSIREELYFKNISEDEIAIIVKTADRIANISKLKEITDIDKRRRLISKYLWEYKFLEEYFDGYLNEIDNAFFELIG